ncbi:hypothetical protein [Streptomyces cupreus]|uniref:Uncharacterized protein n=1 Tax=Streptomyces cupreus TaxID=2759956 RepID=A0A7X1JC51_9ACTN|nr:hypothetical protein [Streptomyces cupreus]
MRARDLAEPYVALPKDADAIEAVRLIVKRRLPGEAQCVSLRCLPEGVTEAFRQGGLASPARERTTLFRVPIGRRRTLKARLSALPDLQRVAPFLGLIRGGTQQP